MFKEHYVLLGVRQIVRLLKIVTKTAQQTKKYLRHSNYLQTLFQMKSGT